MSGVIEDLDLLLKDCLDKIEKAKTEYLEAPGEGSADERLERMIYGRFLDPEPRKAFFGARLCGNGAGLRYWAIPPWTNLA